MRVVIDTNVLISYLFWGKPPIQPVVDELLRSGEVLRSTETFAELQEVAMRSKFDAYMSIARREMFLAVFYDKTRYVTIVERIDACRDPKDNKFLELAVGGKADVIVSGDADLLALDGFRKIRIIDAAALSAR